MIFLFSIVIVIYLISVYYRNLTFVAMWLNVDQSLAASFMPINTRQQRASLPFKPGVLERKVYNDADITFFFILMFAKP